MADKMALVTKVDRTWQHGRQRVGQEMVTEWSRENSRQALASSTGKWPQTGPGTLYRNSTCSRCTIGCKNIGTRTEAMTRRRKGWSEGEGKEGKKREVRLFFTGSQLIKLCNNKNGTAVGKLSSIIISAKQRGLGFFIFCEYIEKRISNLFSSTAVLAPYTVKKGY
jgi:hypothetical protein